MNSEEGLDSIGSATLPPTIFIIFGATGDLFQKKLLPALFDLYAKKFLPARFKIIASARRPFDDNTFRSMMGAMLEKNKPDTEEIKKFLANLSYHQGFFEDASAYKALGEKLSSIDAGFGQCSNKLFYLAVPPVHYQIIVDHLALSGLTVPCDDNLGWTRVLIEKPFGKNAEAAEKLDETLAKLFKEEQIFRIDHYLAKEAVQKIMSFRFFESSLEPIWNNKHIESISINLFERDGINGRGALYEGLGALRDVGQNHILSMLSLVTMEKPKDFSSNEIRRNRADILKHIKKIGGADWKKNVRRGQYEGYLNEAGVEPNSQTETFFSIKTEIDSPRWRNVPLFLTSGKALMESKGEIVINFIPAENRPPHLFKIRSDEKMSAYEKVLLDAIKGDQTLFASTEEIKATWKFISPILENWSRIPLEIYKQGVNPKN